MKRLLSLVLAMAFIFAFAGCGKDKNVENQKEPTNQGSSVNDSGINSQITEENGTTLPSDDNPTSQESKEFITKEKAKEIALSDAGVKESQIRDYEIELDREQGTYYYEISFDADGFEYEYDIDAKSGKIARNYKEKED